MYRLPSLEAVDWTFTAPGLRVHTAAGFLEETDEILLHTADGHLVVLDLDTGRPRSADSTVTLAALGPLGRPLYLREDGTILHLSGRKATPAFDSLDGRVEILWDATGRRTLVVRDGPDGRELLTISGAETEQRMPLPDGPVALAPYGDVTAVGTDSGVAVITLRGEPTERFRRSDGVPVALAFSPSAHRLYVATSTNELLVIERFELDVLERIRLPQAVSELRVDPAGRWILGRSLVSDSVLIISVVGGGAPRMTAATWDEDLPAVAPDGTLLVKRGDDVVALSVDSLAVIGEAPGGNQDRWLIVRWDPRRPALQLARTEQPTTRSDQVRQFYVQVSSTSNRNWADALARDLRLAGVTSQILEPDAENEMYRVVIGPYVGREQAEEIAKQLRMPYWIFADTTSGGP